jgi:hypothetical protein
MALLWALKTGVQMINDRLRTPAPAGTPTRRPRKMVMSESASRH